MKNLPFNCLLMYTKKQRQNKNKEFTPKSFSYFKCF